jgi:arylsulfatase A-like enzyme
MRAIAPVGLALALACGGGSQPAAEADADVDAGTALDGTRPNILVVIGDDLGREQLAAYEPRTAPRTPVMDALAGRGVVFEHAYAYPAGTATRAAIITGQTPTRSGVGAENNGKHTVLHRAHRSVARLLREAGYATSLTGKFDLGPLDGLRRPRAIGFDWHAGPMRDADDVVGKVRRAGYETWQSNRNGERVVEKGYLTTTTADDAIERIEEMPEPWFLWLAFNAPNEPYHAPPRKLHEEYAAFSRAQHKHPWQLRAAIQALDHELGRVLESMPDDVAGRTIVVLTSDGGTPSIASYPPARYDRVKASPYEGGIRVPLIVAGAGVEAVGRSEAWVRPEDIFATLAALAGIEVDDAPVDGRSIAPWLLHPNRANDRETMVLDSFRPNEPRTRRVSVRIARDAEFKLVRTLPGGDQFFELGSGGGIDEGRDLLPRLDARQRASYERLVAALNSADR